jgi:hypothetical protein
MARSTKLLPLVMMTLAILALLSWDAPVAQAAPCGGTQGTALRLGCDNNTATDTTVLNFSTKNATALYVHDTGSGTGIAVLGRSTNLGVAGQGDTSGVSGTGGSDGVFGYGGFAGIDGQGGKYGVYGVGPTGVYGKSSRGCSLLGCGVGTSGTNTSNGIGVFGGSASGTGVSASSTSGTAVAASSANGTALSVTGKARFSRSGGVTVAADESSMTVTLAGVTTSSMVLATAQQKANVYVKAVVPASGSFTIWLTGKAPSGGLRVVYFVLN